MSMETEVKAIINADRKSVWNTIANIEDAAQTISGIEKVEILEKPASGMVGFKWRETRTMFGQKATEVIWITEAVELEFYKTRAESHGAIYTSTLALNESNGATELSMRFSAQPVTFGAKVMWMLTGFLVAGVTKKALAKDLQDIKAAVERKPAV